MCIRDSVETALETGGEKGSDLTSVPLYGLAYGLYYNTAMFQEAGLEPPTTWEEMVDAAKALTDPAKDRYGFALAAGSYTENNHFAFINAAQNGADVFDDEGNPTFTEDGVVKGILRYLDLMQTDRVVNPANAQYNNGSFAVTDSANGKVAMILNQNNADATIVANGMPNDAVRVVGHAVRHDRRVGVVLVEDHRDLAVREVGDRERAVVVLRVRGVDDQVGLHEVEVAQDALDDAVLGEGWVALVVEHVGAVLRRVDEREVVVLGIAASGECEPVPVLRGVCQRLGCIHHLLPGCRGLEARLLEHRLVVVQPVCEAVQRHGCQVAALLAAGLERGLDELVRAADGLHLGLTERQERAGRLERDRPRVADVDDVGPLAGRYGGLDPCLQVGPPDDLQVDGDAGLLGEGVEHGGEDFLVVAEARPLVAGPVGERHVAPAAAPARRRVARAATRAGRGGSEQQCCDGDHGGQTTCLHLSTPLSRCDRAAYLTGSVRTRPYAGSVSPVLVVVDHVTRKRRQDTQNRTGPEVPRTTSVLSLNSP